MAFELIPSASEFIAKQAVNEVIKCNDYTVQYGLTLTAEQALELVEARSQALSENGRVEFGGGVLDKLILEFCDSPYISAHNYTQTLHELLDIFYYYKNETLDLVGDDDLIKYMKTSFDGVCKGSLDLLSEQELDRFARDIRSGGGHDPFDDDDYSGGDYIDYSERGYLDDDFSDDDLSEYSEYTEDDDEYRS